MQPKVSIVIPCYNKVKWIGGMFDSIIAQNWDNIELILVNDGSTDGTREIITVYEHKFIERGYTVTILDQENQGVAMAVRNGIKYVSGDYFCTVDSDDRLACDYFSLTAGWLDNNPQYDGVSCSFETSEDFCYSKDIVWDYSAESSNRLENYILLRMELSVCVYVIKASYLKKCKIFQNFHTNPKCSQEPQLLIPLLGNGGKFKHIPKGLYLRNLEASDKTRNDTFSKTLNLAQEYYELIKLSINKLDKSLAEKTKLLDFAKLGLLKAYLYWTQRFAEADSYTQQWIKEYVSLLKSHHFTAFDFNNLNITSHNIILFFNAVEKCMLKEQLRSIPELPKGKIIGLGVLGKNARIMLPFLKKTPYFPTVLWDTAAQNSSYYNGIHISRPNFMALSKRDLLLVFPSSADIQEEIKVSLEMVKVVPECIYSSQLIDYLSSILFPNFNERQTSI